MASPSARLTTGLFTNVVNTTGIVGGELASDNGVLYFFSNLAATHSCAIVDGAVPTKLLMYGANAATLTGTNTFSGGLALLGTSGVTVAAATALGSGTIYGDGGTLTVSAPLTASNDIELNDGGLYLTANADTTLAGVISGTGPMFFAANATATVTSLAGSNTGTGSLRFVSGTVAIDNATQAFTGYDFLGGYLNVRAVGFGDISSAIAARPNNTIRIANNSGADYTLASSFGNSSTFELRSTSADRIILAAENFFTAANIGISNPAPNNAGIVRVTATNGLGWGTVTLLTGDTTSTGRGGAVELAGNCTLPNPFTVSGEGTGGNGAIRSVSDSNIIGGAVTCAGGAGFNARLAADAGSTLTFTGGITANTTLRIADFWGDGDTVVDSVISDGSVTNTLAIARAVGSGAGVTRLKQANTYTRGTTAAEGTIFAENQTALGTGAATLSTGGKIQSASGGGQYGRLTLGGTLTGTGGTIHIGG